MDYIVLDFVANWVIMKPSLIQTTENFVLICIFLILCDLFQKKIVNLKPILEVIKFRVVDGCTVCAHNLIDSLRRAEDGEYIKI